MKALRYYGREDLRYEDVPEPSPGPGQVKIRVHWAGICGTDLIEYRWGPYWVATEPNPVSGRCIPLTLGHEYSGQVVELGKGVTQHKVGDRVAGDCIWYCGKCYYCLKGLQYNCLNGCYTGGQADGAFAEYMIGPEYIFYNIPDSVSYEFGALAEPIGNAFQMVRRGGVKLGDTVAIMGAGPIGLGVLLGARLCGASKIYVVELAKKRGERALAMGADEYINPKETNPVKQILDLTNGIGVDVSFDCVGHGDTPPLAIEYTRKRGTTVVIGVMAEPTQFDFSRISVQDRIVVASWGYFREVPLALELMASGRIDPSIFITGKVELRDAVEKAFKELIRNPEDNLKILLHPPGS